MGSWDLCAACRHEVCISVRSGVCEGGWAGRWDLCETCRHAVCISVRCDGGGVCEGGWDLFEGCRGAMCVWREVYVVEVVCVRVLAVAYLKRAINLCRTLSSLAKFCPRPEREECMIIIMWKRPSLVPRPPSQSYCTANLSPWLRDKIWAEAWERG